MTEVGSGEGEGFTINLPLPGGSGHQAMLHAFNDVIAPAAAAFQPDIIMVSAGYDGHYMDPLAGFQLTESSYQFLCAGLRTLAQQLCNGRIVFILEGGYHLQSLSASVAASFQGLYEGQHGGDAMTGTVGDTISTVVNTPSQQFTLEEPLNKIQAVLREAQRIHGV